MFTLTVILTIGRNSLSMLCPLHLSQVSSSLDMLTDAITWTVALFGTLTLQPPSRNATKRLVITPRSLWTLPTATLITQSSTTKQAITLSRTTCVIVLSINSTRRQTIFLRSRELTPMLTIVTISSHQAKLTVVSQNSNSITQQPGESMKWAVRMPRELWKLVRITVLRCLNNITSMKRSSKLIQTTLTTSSKCSDSNESMMV